MVTPRLLVKVGGTRPIGTTVFTRSRHTTPPSHTTVSASASISWICCIEAVSSTTPPSVVDCPVWVWPWPRPTSGTPCSRHQRTSSATSAAFFIRATAPGMRWTTLP